MKKNSSIHVAYAEDHLSMRLGVTSYLEQLGDIDIDIQAANGKELIELLDKAATLPDVCMLDISMPEMDGFETVQMIKRKWPEMKTLVLTAFENELYFMRMIKLGANGYLLKRCHPNEIKRALFSIYQYDFYYSDTHARRISNQIRNETVQLPHFSDREIEFMKYCPADLSYNEIATRMSTTVKAIDGYRNRLCEKLNVKGRIGLAVCAIQLGFVQLDSYTNSIVSNSKGRFC